MKPEHKLDDRVTFIITREDPNFDSACDAAASRAQSIFGVTADGHIANVQGSDRSMDSIRIEFVKYACAGGMAGWSYDYEFVTWVERSEE